MNLKRNKKKIKRNKKKSYAQRIMETMGEYYEENHLKFTRQEKKIITVKF